MSENETYSVDIRFVKRNGRKATEWWVIAPNGAAHMRGIASEERAREIAAELNSRPAAPVIAEQATAAPRAAGWSKAARRRSGARGNRDLASQYMADSFGLVSHAAPGTCHYCGLASRTCDCH